MVWANVVGRRLLSKKVCRNKNRRDREFPANRSALLPCHNNNDPAHDCRPALGRFSQRPPPHPRQRHRRPPPRPTAPRSPSSSSRCYARRSSPRRQHTKARSTPATNPSSPGDARAAHECHLLMGDVHASLRYDPGLRYTAAASPKLPARRFGAYQLRQLRLIFGYFLSWSVRASVVLPRPPCRAPQASSSCETRPLCRDGHQRRVSPRPARRRATAPTRVIS